MTRVLVEGNLASRLSQSTEPLEICDPTGTVVGIFTPAAKAGPKVPFTEEEIRQSKSKTGGRPLAEILADLRKS